MTLGSRRLWLVLALTAATVLVGAAGGISPFDRPAAQAEPVRPVGGAAVPEDLGRLADEVAREVEALRGWTFKEPVRRQRSSPEQMRAFLERQIDVSMSGGRLAVVQSFLRTIGLVPPGCDVRATLLNLLEEQVAGYYEPATKTLHLIERAAAMPAAVERLLLAHELTHALDDQYVDLRALIAPSPTRTEDAEVAISSLTEGSATSLMIQFMMSDQKAGRVSLPDLTQYAERELERSRAFLDAPRYFSAMLASYVCGMQFLARGNVMALLAAPDNRAIGEGLLLAAKDVPRSSEQILHPSKYWNPSERDEPVVVDDRAVEKWLERPDRWIVHKDTVGELLTGILTTPPDRPAVLATMQSAAGWTTPAAEGWGGDRFYLLATGSSRAEAARSLTGVRGVWVTAWDSPGDRDEFVAALPGGSIPSGFAVELLGTRGALVLIGFAEAERAEVTAGLKLVLPLLPFPR